MTSDKVSGQRKRLLVLTSTFPRWQGDDEPPFVFDLCRKLGAEFDILVLAPHAPGARVNETLSGIEVLRFRYFFEWGESLAYHGGILGNLRRQPLRYLLVPFFMTAQLLVISRLLRKGKIDLVHAHWLIPQGLLAVLARLLGRGKPPILCTSHGSDIAALRGPVFTALRRFTLRHLDAVTVVSEAMLRRAQDAGAQPARVSILPMGVDARNMFVPDESTPRSPNEILFVGRLVPEKGVELLIRALPAIMARSPGASLTIVGKGPMGTSLRKLCSDLDVVSKVKFVGAMRHELLPDYFRKAALLVLPSYEEGFGLVCAEAMACACPVVCSDLPALREIVSDHETGLLYPACDIEALAECVGNLLQDDALRRELGEAGRRRILEHFDWESIARRYGKLLQGMMDGEGPAGGREGK